MHLWGQSTIIGPDPSPFPVKKILCDGSMVFFNQNWPLSNNIPFVSSLQVKLPFWDIGQNQRSWKRVLRWFFVIESIPCSTGGKKVLTGSLPVTNWMALIGVTYYISSTDTSWLKAISWIITKRIRNSWIFERWNDGCQEYCSLNSTQTVIISINDCSNSYAYLPNRWRAPCRGRLGWEGQPS